MKITGITPHILLITGAPGIGKTTVLRRVAEGLETVHVCGFYTEELREQGIRRGFRLVGLDGSEGIIAHVKFPLRHRVGKYGVDVEVLDRLAQTTLAIHEECAVYLVDEIGKMECLAPGFVTAMGKLFTYDRPLVATIGRKGGSFIAEVKARNDVELLELTHANRDHMPTEALAWLSRRSIETGLG